MYVVEFIPGAAQQAAAARDWWHMHREKAPDAFDEDFAELLTLLEAMPNAVGVCITQRPGVRRAVLQRVGYNVYFTVQRSTVTIIAVWHGRRGSMPELP